MARYARTIWQMDNDLQPLSTLAQVRCLGQDVCPVAERLGCREECGLGSPFHRLHHGSGSPTCCWSKKSSAELEALGRSRGGLTTKIHIRCEGTGRLITFLLTPGQESDITLAEDLMETGSILRRNGHPRLHPKRLVATRYEKRAANFSAMITLASILLFCEIHFDIK